MEYDVDVVQLSADFIRDYPHGQFPELMTKSGRPYSCLIVDSHDGYFICIPFRTSVLHNNAYLFRNTLRSKSNRSGLDYSKIVLISNPAYIDSSPVLVDNDEYKEAMKQMDRISREAVAYIDGYVAHHKGEKLLHHREYDRKYRYSTLQYFHDILGI